jgi:hypothetical protein
MMPEEEISGHPLEAFVGISNATERDDATLEKAIHDAAVQATRNFAGKPMKVLSIEFTPSNPHITQYKVIVAPGG